MEQAPEPQTPDSQTSSEFSVSTGWAIAAVVMALLFLFGNDAPAIRYAGFFAKCFAFLSGTFFGWLGALIGDAIRRFALPDSFYTSGGMGSIIKTKLFWMVGPQLIGLFLGVALGVGFVVS